MPTTSVVIRPEDEEDRLRKRTTAFKDEEDRLRKKTIAFEDEDYPRMGTTAISDMLQVRSCTKISYV